MPTINLTVQSENRRNVTTAYTLGFDSSKIVGYYTNPNTDFTGTTLVEYMPSDFAAQVTVYGVSESETYIATAINGGDNIATATISLTSAEIKALNGTPIKIVDAAGAGKTILPVSGIVNYSYSTAGYSTATQIDFIYHTGAVVCASAATALSGSSSKITRFINVASVAVANDAIYVKVPSADPTAGSGTATVTIAYIVL